MQTPNGAIRFGKAKHTGQIAPGVEYNYSVKPYKPPISGRVISASSRFVLLAKTDEGVTVNPCH